MDGRGGGSNGLTLCPGWDEGFGLCCLGCLGPVEVEAAASLRLGWPVNRPFGCPSLCWEESGGRAHRPLSPGQSGSVVCSHRSSVCTCWGDLVPGWGTGHRQRWPPGQYSLPASAHTQPLSAGPSPSQLLQFCLPLLPPALPTSPDALEILLQIQRCYCIPSFQNILS